MASRRKSEPGTVAPMDAPLPLITIDSKGKFVVGQDSINLIRQIKGEIAVVAVAGIYRYALFC